MRDEVYIINNYRTQIALTVEKIQNEQREQVKNDLIKNHVQYIHAIA